jgi:hypothetical protein
MMILCAAAALAAAALGVFMLERQRAGLSMEEVRLASSPVTLWRTEKQASGPLVVVAHGYAGSRQMMQPTAIALARSGFVVAAFDFHGHGRHPEPMSADVTSLEGTTAQLVEQTLAVANAARELEGATGPVALVGHSMATDVVIRAAEKMEDVAAVVAISMYSDAVTPEFPEKLLIVSGAWEGRLREVALERLRLVEPDAKEGETVVAGDVARRAVAAPLVGHVGVLYSRTTLQEARDWIGRAMGRPATGEVPNVGPWLILLLAALVALAWPLAGLLGPPTAPKRRRGLAVWLPIAAPAIPALAAATLVPDGLLGLSAFGGLVAFFGVWGVLQIALLWREELRPQAGQATGFLLLLVWGLGLFAPALDRYGASFVPTGPRIEVMLLLLAGTMPFCLGDALVTRGVGWVPWIVARIAPLAALLAAMALSPRLGIAFTVLPVLVLFWLVYGLAGRWIAARSGPGMTGLALGIILAWALAASTPLVAS